MSHPPRDIELQVLWSRAPEERRRSDRAIPTDAAAMAAYRERWSRMEAFHFAVVDAGADRMLGEVSLDDIDYEARSANVAYWIDPACRGQGLAGWAVAILAAFASRELGLVQLRLCIAKDNGASLAVARKLASVPTAETAGELHFAVAAADCVARLPVRWRAAYLRDEPQRGGRDGFQG
jgi:RimJ/RimL family protein N-acetyltransferase